MNSSNRAPAPPPLRIGAPIRSVTSPTSTISSHSSDKTTRSFSSDYGSLPSYPGHNRASSLGSSQSACSSRSSSRKTTSPTVNVYTTCGRHSNQWLFSGWSKLGGKKH